MNPLPCLQAIILAQMISGAIGPPARAAESRQVAENRTTEIAEVRIVKRFGESGAIQEYGETLGRQLATKGATAAAAGPVATGDSPPAVVLENAQFRYSVSSVGRSLGFVDRATGVDYLKPGGAVPCALVRRAGREFPATGAVLVGDRLTLKFTGAEVQAVLRVEPRR